MSTLRNRYFFLIDLLLLPAVAVLAFALRLDTVADYHSYILLYIALAVPIKLITFRMFGLYSRFWRYASIDELVLIVLAVAVSTIATASLLFLVAVPLAGLAGFPRSVPLIDAVLTLIAVGGPRFAARGAWQRRQRARRRRQAGPEKDVLVMGAGDAGAMIVHEMMDNPQLGLLPVGFLDDNEQKHGVRIHGVPVLGGRERIPALVGERDIDEVIIAMPSASGTAVREVLAICKRAGVPARTVPGLHDILSGQASINEIRDLEIEDLLRREPVRTNIAEVERMLYGRRVLVTGAGGSIGSELCNQIARCQPSALTLLGHGEHSVFSVANQMERLWPQIPARRVIADVRDPNRLAQAFEVCRPEIVFHAAAHKHVPLMEENVAEAITNNVLGTARLLQASEEYGVARFVLISTDKAVNPTSVMGASKRLAELLVQVSARRCGRPYVAVRFGNVLGSRGSVVPLFREQIARGGPVRVTHPEVRRYFMTIAEAVQLVLQAAALGQGGEVFLLDMGEPVRITELARDMIRLSGLEVGRDVAIVYTGLRPGEKLTEELFVKGEEYAPTHHEKIYIAHDGARRLDDSPDLEQVVAELVAEAQRGDEAQVRAKLKAIVPEYGPAVPGGDLGHGADGHV